MPYWDYEIGAVLDCDRFGHTEWKVVPGADTTFRYIDHSLCTLYARPLKPGERMYIKGDFVYYIDSDPTRDVMIVTQSRWQAGISRLTVPLSYWWFWLRYKVVKTWHVWTEPTNGRH